MVTKLLIFTLFALLVILNESNANSLNTKAEVATEFVILHNNDMNTPLAQASIDSEKYGYFARAALEVRKYREAAKNGGMPVFYLNAGDTYTGIPWFSIFKNKIALEFLKKLQPDAISLGNHELDKNVAELVPFLNEVNFSVLAANLELKNAPEIEQSKSFARSTVLEVNGVKVGVIGYLTAETKNLIKPTAVEFKQEIESINEEAVKLKASGINIIIALGHSSDRKDEEIALKCPEIDIVIGGHRRASERIDMPYSIIVRQKSGKDVPVVETFGYTKYLGKLHVQFDKNGNLVEFNGTPILLNASLPTDDDVLALWAKYRSNIRANTVVGHTKVHLEGKSSVCGKEECNLGNLITDGMIYARVLENQGGQYWTDAAIALFMSGGIQTSIAKRPDGSVTEDDILTVLPSDNDLFVTQITGKTLRNALEHAATVRNKASNGGGFLQVSGIRAVYDLDEKEGERVVAVEVRCADCEVPLFEPLNNEKFYKVLIPQHLLKGGDGHVFTEENGVEAIRLEKNDKDALAQYMKQRKIVYPELEERIIIRNGAAAILSSLLMIMSGFFIVKYFS